jgi:hypothetical protein
MERKQHVTESTGIRLPCVLEIANPPTKDTQGFLDVHMYICKLKQAN